MTGVRGLGWRAPWGARFLACLALVLAAAGLPGCSAPDESRWPSLVILATPETVPALGQCNLEEFKRMDGTVVRVVARPARELAARLEKGEQADLVLVSDPALLVGMAEKGLVAGEPWQFKLVRGGKAATAGRGTGMPADHTEQLAGAVLSHSGHPVAARRLWGYLEKGLQQPALGFAPAFRGKSPGGGTRSGTRDQGQSH